LACTSTFLKVAKSSTFDNTVGRYIRCIITCIHKRVHANNGIYVHMNNSGNVLYTWRLLSGCVTEMLPSRASSIHWRIVETLYLLWYLSSIAPQTYYSPAGSDLETLGATQSSQ